MFLLVKQVHAFSMGNIRPHINTAYCNNRLYSVKVDAHLGRGTDEHGLCEFTLNNKIKCFYYE